MKPKAKELQPAQHVIMPWIAVVRNSFRKGKHKVDRPIPLVIQDRNPRDSIINPAFDNDASSPHYYGRTIVVDSAVSPEIGVSKSNFDKSFTSNGSQHYEAFDRCHLSTSNGTLGNGDNVYETVGTLLRSKEEERRLKLQEKWVPSIGYYISWICITLGLINVWRFPSIAYNNGGGAFIFAYVIISVLMGIPMFILETAIGQFTGNRPNDAWKCIPLLKGLTFAQAISSFFLVVCFIHVMGLSLVYLYDSFQGSPFPWGLCNVTWSDSNCTDTSEVNDDFIVHWNHTSPQEQYLRYHVWQDLEQKDYSNLNWYLAVACVVATLIILITLVKGFWIIQKIAFLFVGYTVLYFVCFLVMLLIDQEGAAKGIGAMFFPDWKQLNNLEIWYDACEHVLITLGAGLGPMVTYSSRNHFGNNIVRHSIIFVVLEVLFSLLSFCVISASLGNMSYLRGSLDEKLLVEDNSGMGLIFVSTSHLFSNLNFIPVLWLFLFFIAVFLMGLMSVIVTVDVILNILWDKNHFLSKRKWLTRSMVCIFAVIANVALVQTVGPRGFNILDRYGIGAPCVVYAVLEVISMTWIYGLDNFRSDVSFMVNSRIPGIISFLWVGVIPLGLAGVGIAVLVMCILHWLKEGISDLPFFIAQWIVFAIPMVIIFIGILRSLCDAIALGCCDRIRYVLSISSDWGPSDPFFRRQWLRSKQGQSARATSTLRSNGHTTVHIPLREGSISTISRSWNT